MLTSRIENGMVGHRRSARIAMRLVAAVVALIGSTPAQLDGRTFVTRHAAEVRSVAFDPVRQVVMAVTGARPSLWRRPTETWVTWQWDGRFWTDHGPSDYLPSFREPTLAFDPHRGRVVMTGVRTVEIEPTSVSWGWNGERWEALATASSVSFEARELGGGCPGGPRLTARRTANGLLLELDDLPDSETAQLIVGAARSARTTPVALDSAGMSRCRLIVDPEHSIAVRNVAGTATVVVPNGVIAPGRASGEFACRVQAFAVAPRANPASVVASNAIEVRLGARH